MLYVSCIPPQVTWIILYLHNSSITERKGRKEAIAAAQSEVLLKFGCFLLGAWRNVKRGEKKIGMNHNFILIPFFIDLHPHRWSEESETSIMSFVIYGHAEERKRPHSTQFVNIWMRDWAQGDVLDSRNQKESGFKCLKTSYDAGWKEVNNVCKRHHWSLRLLEPRSAISFLRKAFERRKSPSVSCRYDDDIKDQSMQTNH